MQRATAIILLVLVLPLHSILAGASGGWSWKLVLGEEEFATGLEIPLGDGEGILVEGSSRLVGAWIMVGESATALLMVREGVFYLEHSLIEVNGTLIVYPGSDALVILENVYVEGHGTLILLSRDGVAVFKNSKVRAGLVVDGNTYVSGSNVTNLLVDYRLGGVGTPQILNSTIQSLTTVYRPVSIAGSIIGRLMLAGSFYEGTSIIRDSIIDTLVSVASNLAVYWSRIPQARLVHSHVFTYASTLGPTLELVDGAYYLYSSRVEGDIMVRGGLLTLLRAEHNETIHAAPGGTGTPRIVLVYHHANTTHPLVRGEGNLSITVVSSTITAPTLASAAGDVWAILVGSQISVEEPVRSPTATILSVGNNITFAERLASSGQALWALYTLLEANGAQHLGNGRIYAALSTLSGTLAEPPTPASIEARWFTGVIVDRDTGETLPEGWIGNHYNLTINSPGPDDIAGLIGDENPLPKPHTRYTLLQASSGGWLAAVTILPLSHPPIEDNRGGSLLLVLGSHSIVGTGNGIIPEQLAAGGWGALYAATIYTEKTSIRLVQGGAEVTLTVSYLPEPRTDYGISLPEDEILAEARTHLEFTPQFDPLVLPLHVALYGITIVSWTGQQPVTLYAPFLPEMDIVIGTPGITTVPLVSFPVPSLAYYSHRAIPV